jgi:ring-1,2-phenylacetyl-CoA epoxidase subunit PaaD
MVGKATFSEAVAKVMQLLEGVPDPEVPVLSVVDLGIIREVRVDSAAVTVVITPTYTGCPAMDMIRATIRMTLASAGYNPVDIQTVLSPAWTTEWLSENARQKLEAFGIAPPNPVPSVCHLDLFQPDDAVRCPRCQSYRTELVSRFGSTACKALYKCNDCHEPFDYFKCH